LYKKKLERRKKSKKHTRGRGKKFREGKEPSLGKKEGTCQTRPEIWGQEICDEKKGRVQKKMVGRNGETPSIRTWLPGVGSQGGTSY